jgi:hypothetical protein
MTRHHALDPYLNLPETSASPPLPNVPIHVRPRVQTLKPLSLSSSFASCCSLQQPRHCPYPHLAPAPPLSLLQSLQSGRLKPGIRYRTTIACHRALARDLRCSAFSHSTRHFTSESGAGFRRDHSRRHHLHVSPRHVSSRAFFRPRVGIIDWRHNT